MKKVEVGWTFYFSAERSTVGATSGHSFARRLCRRHAVAELLVEARRADERRAGGDEALVVHLEAVVERVGIGGYFP